MKEPLTPENAHLFSYRTPDGRFAEGNPGRPMGSRNRVSKRVAMGILGHFEAHQNEVLAKLRHWYLPEYVRLVARLLTRTVESKGPDLETLSAADVAALVADARAALARIEAGEGTLAELEAALIGAGTVNNGANTVGEAEP